MAGRKEIKIGTVQNTDNNITNVSLVYDFDKYYINIDPKYWDVRRGQWKNGKWIPIADATQVNQLIEQACKKAERIGWLPPSHPTVQEPPQPVTQPEPQQAVHSPKQQKKQSLFTRLRHIFTGCIVLIAVYFAFAPASKNTESPMKQNNQAYSAASIRQKPPPVAPIANTNNKSTAPLIIYIGNRKTHKFHWPGCSSVKQMYGSNMVEFATRDAAVNAGYVPCQRCHP